MVIVVTLYNGGQFDIDDILFGSFMLVFVMENWTFWHGIIKILIKPLLLLIWNWICEILRVNNTNGYVCLWSLELWAKYLCHSVAYWQYQEVSFGSLLILALLVCDFPLKLPGTCLVSPTEPASRTCFMVWLAQDRPHCELRVGRNQWYIRT